MPILTLTTDLGNTGHYVAALKGTLLSMAPDVTLLDVTHDIPPFNLLEAAFVVQSTFTCFPEGTIHLVGVDPEGGRQNAVVMKFQGHYFVGPDNGVMSLIRARATAETRIVTNPSIPRSAPGKSFLVQNLYGPAAIFLVQGGKFEDVGDISPIREFFWGEPTYTENSLRGTILHIDRFGNAITNITREEFLRIKGERSFQIFIRSARLQRIVSSYADVARGEALAIFSGTGHLEIALREGSAAQLLGLKVQDMLTIEFYA